MKLRIKGNSIRLRLLRSEVDKFAEAGHISEEICFGTSALKYSLSMSSDADAVRAAFADDEIVVFIPEQAAIDWTTNENVGFEIEQRIGRDRALTIIVEKDFVCVDRPNDPDRDDAFPNPNVIC
jgi:hypothetical protein